MDTVGKGRVRTVPAVSAGGVIFRRPPGAEGDSEQVEIVLVGQSRNGRWGLPKGGPGPDETIEEAALREVKEETGLAGRIVGSLGHIEYWFAGRGTRFHKVVHFYLMEAIEGDVSQHDLEHDQVRWFTLPEAYAAMSYSNERVIVRRGEEMLKAKGFDQNGT